MQGVARVRDKEEPIAGLPCPPPHKAQSRSAQSSAAADRPGAPVGTLSRGAWPRHVQVSCKSALLVGSCLIRAIKCRVLKKMLVFPGIRLIFQNPAASQEEELLSESIPPIDYWDSARQPTGVLQLALLLS